MTNPGIKYRKGDLYQFCNLTIGKCHDVLSDGTGLIKHYDGKWLRHSPKDGRVVDEVNCDLEDRTIMFRVSRDLRRWAE